MDDPTAKAVAATLRQMAGWGLFWDSGTPADGELLSLASQVEAMEPGDVPCPMCEEIECDEGCALAPATPTD